MIITGRSLVAVSLVLIGIVGGASDEFSETTALFNTIIARQEAIILKSNARKHELNIAWREHENPDRSDADQARFSHAYLDAITEESDKVREANLEIGRASARLFERLGFVEGPAAARLGLSWADGHDLRSTKIPNVNRLKMTDRGQTVLMNLKYERLDQRFSLSEVQGQRDDSATGRLRRLEEGDLHLTLNLLKDASYSARLSMIEHGTMGDVEETELKSYPAEPISIRETVTAFARPASMRARSPLSAPRSCPMLFKGAP